MKLIGTSPRDMNLVTDEWCSTRVVAYYIDGEPVMEPRAQISDGVAATAAQAIPIFVDSEWRYLRAERNKRLAESDWTMSPDSSVDSIAWSVYRQALRDLPENTADPFNPIWPVPPS